MNAKRKHYIESCKISIVETVDLGGYRQKIAIEGKSKELPIVVCLHGGPVLRFLFRSVAGGFSLLLPIVL